MCSVFSFLYMRNLHIRIELYFFIVESENFFRVFFILSTYSENTWGVFKRICRIWQILVCLFAVHKFISDYVERICAYMERTQRDKKLRISLLIMVPHEFFFITFTFYTRWVGWSPKISRYWPFNMHYLISFNFFMLKGRGNGSWTIQTRVRRAGHPNPSTFGSKTIRNWSL